MRKLEVRLTGTQRGSFPVGTLAESEHRVYFEYDPAFLERHLHLSPFRLPNAPGLIEHRRLEFGPLPGLFDDSLPDGWGLLVMDRHFRRLGLELSGISALDRLAWLGMDTMGALTYHPPADKESAPAAFDLHQLSANAREVLAGKTAEVLPQLLRAGGSPGGARPKVLVGVRGSECVSGEAELPAGYEHWIVKLAADVDMPDAGSMEFAYSLMARAAGIDMPETRIFETVEGDRLFGAKRFDREQGRRIHVHTLGNLLETNFRIPSCDYRDLFTVTHVLTRDHRDSVRVLRRMVFNILTHNRDDHVKNFAFLLNDRTGEWSLSPAYDLVLAEGPGGEHSMTVAGEGRAPTMDHVLELRREASLRERLARDVVREVSAATARWPDLASQAGVPTETAERIAHRFVRLE